MIYLKQINSITNQTDNSFPYSIPLFKAGFSLAFKKKVTIIIGENGSGKSTILKYIASNIGFNLDGGNINSNYQSYSTIPEINGFNCIWQKKTRNGFYFKSDTFDNFYKYIETDPLIASYYNRPFSTLSHGESFLELFSIFRNGLFLLDEPESALSPQNQLAFLRLINQLEKGGQSQFIILTHSPIVMAYPNADLYVIEDSELRKKNYKETEHYFITKRIIDNPDSIFHHLFCDDE